jgi:hypothetical protein
VSSVRLTASRSGEDGQWDADRRGVARIVEAADGQGDVIECGQRVAMVGLKSCQKRCRALVFELSTKKFLSRWDLHLQTVWRAIEPALSPD